MTARANTTSGTIEGIEGDGVVRFRGVPYASAARFAPPSPAPGWNGVRAADAHGPIAPQPSSRLRVAMGELPMDQGEDCLTLTIATPGVDDAKRPVIVFLHGGAYLSGAASLDWYDGATLARDGGCVVVGVNYRLGALGFLRLPGIGEGNAGLLDMVAALRWVQDNAASFGGDPGCVTLVGQSAGGHAIMCLLAMPETAGLFHRGILHSPPAARAPHSQAQAEEHARFLCEMLQINKAVLPGLPVARLLEGQMHLARGTARFADISPPFLPVIEGLQDPGDFIAAAAAGAAARGVALIIGTTREEMHAFFAADPQMASPDMKQVARRFAELAGDAAAIELYRRRRPTGSVADLLGDLATDHLFLFPSLALADAVGAAGGTAFVYQFDWAPPGSRFAACHCIDLPFLFGNPAAWPGAAMLEGGDPAEIAAISAAMRSAWCGFAAAGTPDRPGLPWPAYAQGRATMRFDRLLGVVGDLAGATWRGGFA